MNCQPLSPTVIEINRNNRDAAFPPSLRRQNAYSRILYKKEKMLVDFEEIYEEFLEESKETVLLNDSFLQ